MATSSNLSSIIRFYAEKQGSAFIDFRDFCTYMRKYAEHHMSEEAELVKYIGESSGTVAAELRGLEEKHIACLFTSGGRKLIASAAFFSVKFATRYKEILVTETIPYPVMADLPKNFPIKLLEEKDALEYISASIGRENLKSPLLYVMRFTKEIPPVLLPACVPIRVLVETAQKKIKRILRKEEFHDYFEKKLKSTNPTKEISIKNFFTTFVDNASPEYFDFSKGDDYYVWAQACYLIRIDFEKIQDKTLEDINILQAIKVSEFYNSYLKEQFQQQQKRDEALKELEANLAKPPFFYSMPQILKFNDQNGRLLYGQYSEEDLHDFIQKSTTDGDSASLPRLLVFKVESGTRYYVYKEKVVQLIVRLCNEAHDTIETDLLVRWYDSLLDYEKFPEMTDENQFEVCVRHQVEEKSPVLWALLNAAFMTLLAFERNEDAAMQGFQLFVNGELLPYRELLMLSRSSILSQVKAKLPFIYTVPVLSWLLALINSKKKAKEKLAKAAAAKEREQEEAAEQEEDEKKKSSRPLSKKERFAQQAKELSKDYVPEGSTIDRELNYLEKQWNKMISQEVSVQLTADVNALIRDYLRRVISSLSSSSFTKERIRGLAESLVRTPNMQRIKETEALTEYVELYMLRLLSK